MGGFSATIIEAPEKLTSSGLKIPHNHLHVCKAYPMLTAGNAAGNTRDPLNLNGSITTFSSDVYGAAYPPTTPVNSRRRRRVRRDIPRL